MDISTLIILSAICFVLGIVLDNLIHLFLAPTAPSKPIPSLDEPGSGTGAKDQRSDQRSGARVQGRTPQHPSSPAPVLPSSPAAMLPGLPAVEPPESSLGEVAHLWRDPDTKRLAIQIGGKLYQQNGELTPQQAGELTAVANELSAWLAPAGQAAQAGPAQPAEARPAEVFNPIQEQIQSGDLAEEEKVRPVSINPISALVSSLQNEIKAPETPDSLAGQVNQILQEKLLNSPLANRGIRITEAPDHTLAVWVGLEHYSGLEAVPDPEVRQLIQSAVQEWGKRMSITRSRQAG